MKVLHVESGRHLYGGARQVLYLLQGLQREGVENLLACPQDSEIQRAAQPHSSVFALPMTGDLDLALVGRLRALIRRHQPDIVHLHSRRGADLLGGVAARLERAPAVLSRRVDNPEPRWWTAVKYRLYDRIVAISEGIRQVLLAEGVPAGRVVCVHSAVVPGEYQSPCNPEQFRRAFGLAGDGPVIGVIAQLIPRKGHRHLLAVLPGLVEEVAGLQVLFFGQGPLQDELEQDVAALGLAGKVHFAGFRRDLPRWLGCLDLVVHPAEMEGLGVSLLQAAAAGVALVGSRAGGIPEIVVDGETGILLEPGDRQALAAAVRRLLSDDVLRRRLGAGGRKRVESLFSVDAMVAGNLAVYRDVLAGKGRG